MEYKKISELTTRTQPTGDELIPFADNGENGVIKASTLMDGGRIDAEVARATGIEAELSTQIQDEVERAQGVERTLSNDFSSIREDLLLSHPSPFVVGRRLNNLGVGVAVIRTYPSRPFRYVLGSSEGSLDKSGIVEIDSSFHIIDMENFLEIRLMGYIPGISSFFGCTNARKIDLSGAYMNMGNSMENYFRDCTCATEIDLGEDLDTSDVTNFYAMFDSCKELVSLNLGTIDFAKATNINYFLSNCYKLTTISGTLSNIKLDIGTEAPLTRESALVLINGLYDFASAGDTGTHRLTLSRTTVNDLSSTDISIATEKGWSIGAVA